MSEITTVDQGREFRELVIKAYEKLLTSLKAEANGHAFECTNKSRIEIEILELEFQVLPAKRNDLQAYITHTSRKS